MRKNGGRGKSFEDKIGAKSGQNPQENMENLSELGSKHKWIIIIFLEYSLSILWEMEKSEHIGHLPWYRSSAPIIGAAKDSESQVRS